MYKSFNLKNNRGFTLSETLIAVSVFVIVMSIIIGTFIQEIRSQRVASSMMAVNDSMSLAIEQISREMRTGFNFCTKDVSLTNVSADVIAQCSSLSNDPKTYEIQFVNAKNEVIRYRIDKGDKTSAIERGIDMLNPNNTSEITDTTKCAQASGVTVGDFCYQKITADSVYVDSFKVILVNNNNTATTPDKHPPKITLGLGVTSSEPDIKNYNIISNIQTTISTRNML